ncbi:MAG: DUF4197 domain-containing protein [Bacteroidales bacterium]|nr:DUF4197 domain-containing protein [Bacteroidales bacterium]
MKRYKIISIALIFIFSSCAELSQIANQSIGGSLPLSQNEIINGLKESLVVGASKSVNILAVTDGYYKDELVKILLPPEAEIIVKNINKIPGGAQLLDDVLLKINRAAEDAAKEAKPIFVNSISAMSFTDALGILKGGDYAATNYLRNSTYGQLVELYKPKINSSLDKKLVGTISTNQSWDLLTGQWNEMAKTLIGQIAGFKPIEVKLDEYLTQKALDGLFLKIGDEEKRIRKDPLARGSELLKRVFAKQDS